MSDDLKKRDAEEKELQDILDRFREGDLPPSDNDAPVPIDPEAEKKALKELISQLTASGDGDPDTLVSVITLDDLDNADADTSPSNDEGPAS